MTAAPQDRPTRRTSPSGDAGRTDGAGAPDGQRGRPLRRGAGAAAVVAAGLLVAPGAHAATTTTGPTPPARTTTTAPDPAATPDDVDPTVQPPASTTAEPAVPPASPTDAGAAPGVDDAIGDDSGGAGRDAAAKAQRARERREAREALARRHAAAERRRAAARRRAAKEARERRAAEATDEAPAEDPTDAGARAGGTAADPADSSLLGGDAELLRAPAAIPDLFIARFRIPPFLLPIYQAAGVEYGIRWEVLAAINEIETDYGRNLNVSSAGAQGWMQFMPATWRTYGTDADGDGEADPMDPVDAIFSAARYLKAAGAEDDVRKAVFAYNHADWYVDSVMLRARLISGLPEPLVSSLTGLAQGTLPVRGAVADPADPGAPGTSSGTPAPDADAPRWSARPGDDRAAQISAPAGTEVVAVQDGTIVGTGHDDTKGHWIRLRDVFGNVYTYAHLGAVADTYAAPESTAAEEAAAAAADRASRDDPAPSGPATAGTQPALDAIAAMQSGSTRAVTPAPGSPLLPSSGTPGGPNGATTPPAHERDETVVPRGYGVPVPPPGPGDPAAAAAPAGGVGGGTAVRTAAPAVPATAIPATRATLPGAGSGAAGRAAAPVVPPSRVAPAPGATPVTATAPAPGVAPTTATSPAPGVAPTRVTSLLAPTALPSTDVVLVALRSGGPSTATLLARGPLSTLPTTGTAALPAPVGAGAPTATATATATSSTAASAPAGRTGSRATSTGWAGIPSTATAAAAPDRGPATTARDERPSKERSGTGGPRIVLKALRKGARVNGGTVLGTIGRAPRPADARGDRTASMAFGVRPAGRGAPRVDPRPLLEGWRLLSATAERDVAERDTGERRSALFGIRAGSATAGQVLLLGKDQLQARVLADDRIEIPDVGRAQIRAGLIDRRVLATLAYLAASGHDLRISSLRRPGAITVSGNVSEHDSGNAVDIAAVDGQIISPRTQGPGSITDRVIRLLLRLQGTTTPHQIISLMGPDDFAGASNVLAMGDHADHIHVGFAVAGGEAAGERASALKPGQWDDLVARLGEIENPQVASKPSRFALKVRR